MKPSVLALTPTEAAALVDLSERQVRKEIEHGLFEPGRPPRIGFAVLVYLRALRLMALDLAVSDRRKLLDAIRDAVSRDPKQETVELTDVLCLRVGRIVQDLADRLRAFESWKQTVAIDRDVLGGEPVFAGTRIAVRRIGGLAERGATEEIFQDYPDLTQQDVEFARWYARAYPRLGRPRAHHQAAPR